MRKLITFILISLSIGVNAQMLTRMIPVMALPDTNVYETYCTEYQAVYDAMTTPPSEASASAQNTMVESLVNEGYWARMEWLNIYATEYNSDDEALIDWINLGSSTLSGTPTWTSNEGYTGASSAYILSGWNPSTDAVTSSINDMSLAVYNRLDVGSGVYYDIGCTDGTNQLSFSSGYNGTSYLRINASASISVSNSNEQGFYIGTRTNSNSTEIYKNGESLVSGTVSSTSVPNVNVSVLGRWNGSGGNSSINQISIAFVMDGVNDEEADELNTIFETYMDALGKGVQ